MLLGFDDTLPRRPERVLVAGTSGAGKTTLAARVGMALGLPHVELDGLFHGPGWVPRAEFEAEVDEFSSRPRWVTEWQYRQVRELLADRADLVAWLDLPRSTVMSQVVVRTIRRRLSRQVLWNGNIEPPVWTIFTDPSHIVRWAWTTNATTARRVEALRRDRPELVVVRLRSRDEVRRWLDSIAGP